MLCYARRPIPVRDGSFRLEKQPSQLGTTTFRKKVPVPSWDDHFCDKKYSSQVGTTTSVTKSSPPKLGRLLLLQKAVFPSWDDCFCDKKIFFRITLQIPATGWSHTHFKSADLAKTITVFVICLY